MSCTLHIRCKRVGDFKLLVQDSDEVSNVKESITREQRIPKDKQTLTFDGLILEDSYRLKDYGIKDDSSLFLSLPLGFSRDIKVCITLPSGPTVKFLANENVTVARLKEELWRLHRLLAKSYEFVFNGALLKENQTLASCGLKDESILTTVQYMSTEPENKLNTFRVYVMDLAGKRFTLQVYPSTTVDTLKQAIETKERIPVNQQRLMFEGNHLEDGRTLMDYKIQKGSTIYLLPCL